MRRFPDYKDTLRIANEDSTRVFTEIEDERHGMNHAVVGSIVARNWALSDALRTAILRHHDTSLFTGMDDRAHSNCRAGAPGRTGRKPHPAANGRQRMGALPGIRDDQPDAGRG